MPNFQIASDLHIEYKNEEVPDPLTLITPSADVLILAGDIGSYYKYYQLKSFLQKLCPYFKVVLYVPGNHEYYRQTGYQACKMDFLLKQFMKIEKNINNLYILDRSSVKIDDVCIVGCTLWSDATSGVPKFIVRVQGMDKRVYRQKYEGDLAYINKMIKYCKKKDLKLLVITHHCPTYSVIKSNKKKKDKYISLYASNLDDLLTKDQVHTWVCGHIHSNFDKITNGGTRLVGNQKGKPRDNITDYNKSFVISV